MLQISVVAQLVELWYIIYERMPPLVGRIVVAGSSPVNIRLRYDIMKNYAEDIF